MTKRLGLVFSILLVALLSVPTLAWLALKEPGNKLYGYVDEIPARPARPAAALLDKSWQKWAERYYDVHFGFRAELVRTFNETLFRTFREMPRLRLYSTPEAGLFSGMSLQYLNAEIAEKPQYEQRYARSAARIKQMQTLLEAQGKAFVVVIAASKPYVYPESLGERYLSGGREGVLERGASFGKALQAAGVNVVDSAPMLRAFARDTNVPMHPKSGVHWNVYAGCLVAEQVLDQARSRFPALQPFACGIPHYDAPAGADLDGLNLLNIWSGGGVYQNTPLPSLMETDPAGWRPSLVFVSDSFSDQILGPLQQAHAYSRVVNSGYFRVRELDEGGAGLQRTHHIGGDLAATRKQVLDDIVASDIVVLQMVDYNLSHDGYDLPDYLLTHYPAAGTPPAAPALAQPVAAPVLNVLALVDPDNRSNPVLVPSRTRLVGDARQLLAATAKSRWDVVAVLQQAAVRNPDLVRELEKQGYTVAVNGKDGVLALPRQADAPAHAPMQWQWGRYGEPQGANAAIENELPSLASTQPVDFGFYSQELVLDRPVLIRASFEGKVADAGPEPRAAHLSLLGIKPIFSLPGGTYTAKDEFFAILPAQGDGKPVRLAFVLGGWTRGSGTIRLTSLDVYPLSLSGAAPQYAANQRAAAGRE